MITDAQAYEFAAAYSVAMLWLGFWLGKHFYGWRAARLKKLLELERIMNRTGCFPLPWSEKAQARLAAKLMPQAWRGGRQ